jgi:hypothetical protein
MTRIGKGYNLAVLTIIVMGLFLSHRSAYSSSFYSSNEYLRVPIEDKERIKRLLWLEKVKEIVRRYNKGMCSGHSCLLVQVLRMAGEPAVLMGLFKKRKEEPYHVYVRTKSWGDIDIFPEGNNGEPYNGNNARELTENYQKLAKGDEDLAINILQIADRELGTNYAVPASIEHQCKVLFIKGDGEKKGIFYKDRVAIGGIKEGGSIIIEIQKGTLKVKDIFVPTYIKDWEWIYRQTVAELRNKALEKGVDGVHFLKVRNDIYLKYILEYFDIERIRSPGRDGANEWFMPQISGKTELYDFLLKPKIIDGKLTWERGFNIVGYNESGKDKPEKLFPGHPVFKIKKEDRGHLTIHPKRLRKKEGTGYTDYIVIYNRREKRFRLKREWDGKIMPDYDFRLVGNLEIICRPRPLASVIEGLRLRHVWLGRAHRQNILDNSL